MRFPLKTLEKKIDPVIIERGIDYYRGDCVSGLTALTESSWEAKVEGTRNYRVSIEIRNSEVTGYTCTCPYDYGPVCKHIVAVLYAIRNDTGVNKKQAVPREKPVLQQVEDVLNGLSPQELKKIIIRQAGEDGGFRNRLLARFADLSAKGADRKYVPVIRAYIRAAVDESRYWDDEEQPELSEPLRELLENARQTINGGHPEQAFDFCGSVLRELRTVGTYVDDPSGDFDYLLEETYGLIHRLCRKKLTDATSKELFGFLLKHAEDMAETNPDWAWPLAESAVRLVRNRTDEKSLADCLERIKKHDLYFGRKNATAVLLAMRKRTGTRTQVDAFIEENLSIPEIRDEAIKRALGRKEFERAEELALEGIRQCGKSEYGANRHWYETMQDICLKWKNPEKSVEYGLELLKIGGAFHHYEKLKKAVPSRQWPSVLQQVIRILDGKGHGIHDSVLPEILKREKQYPRLMAIVRKRPDFHALSSYDTVLKRDYAPELADLYEKAVIRFLDKNSGRSSYQEACRMLRRMIKLGNADRVKKLIQRLLQKHPRKPALRDELSRV